MEDGEGGFGAIITSGDSEEVMEMAGGVSIDDIEERYTLRQRD